MQLAEGCARGRRENEHYYKQDLLQQGLVKPGKLDQRDNANGCGLSAAQIWIGTTSRVRYSMALLPRLQSSRRITTLGTTGRSEPSASTSSDLMHQEKQQDMAAFQPAQEQLDRYAAQVTGLMGGYPGTDHNKQ